MSIVKKIAEENGVPEHLINRIVNSSNHAYKTYEIAKKNGDTRTICHPSKKVKALQYWLNQNVFCHLPVHSSVYSYRSGLSILDVAKEHVGKKYFLKLDFKAFFPSITADDLRRHLHKHNNLVELDRDDIEVALKIVSYQEALTIGSPSSPILSNSILYDFDDKLTLFCIDKGVTYTRYADDLTFSTNDSNVLTEINSFTRELLQGFDGVNLKINEDKTQFLSKKGRVRILGLILTSDGKISVGREKKREIRSLVNRFKYDAIEPDHDFNGNVLSTVEEKKRSLQGYISFIESIEPDFISSLKNKYDENVIEAIKKFSYEEAIQSRTVIDRTPS